MARSSHRIALSLAAFAAAAATEAADAQALLASAPVDASVFRDGEVQRSAKPFGHWTLVCDTIARLGHKFCSLRSAPALLGTVAIDLTVSTGDDGRPAALVRLPFGVWLPSGLSVEALGGGRIADRHVPVAICGQGGCEAVWTLNAAEITALRTGSGLRLTVRAGKNDVPVSGTPAGVVATIPALGFAQAVAASLDEKG